MPSRQISLWHVVFAVMLVIIGILVWQLIIARNMQISTISSPISSATQTALIEPVPAQDTTPVFTDTAEPAAELTETVLPETSLPEALPEAEPAVPAQTAIQTQTNAVASPSFEPDDISQTLDGALLPGIVSSRIDAYQRLLETGVPSIYTIQVLTTGTDETPFLARSLNLLDRSGLLDSTYVCLTQYQGSPIWLILFGQYNWVDDARAAINDLPPELWQNQPFVQNVETVRCSTVRS